MEYILFSTFQNLRSIKNLNFFEKNRSKKIIIIKGKSFTEKKLSCQFNSYTFNNSNGEIFEIIKILKNKKLIVKKINEDETYLFDVKELNEQILVITINNLIKYQVVLFPPKFIN
jgi:hypothetical protein